MKSETGSTLSLIAGILSSIILFLVLIVLTANISYQTNFPIKLFLFLLFIFLIGLTITLLFFLASKKMKNKKTTKEGAIISLVTGILTFNLFAIIGGAIGLSDSKKNENKK
jgi:hypothetical protein